MRSISLPEQPTGHSAPITHVATSPDDSRLASCSYDGTVIIWTNPERTSLVPNVRIKQRRLINSSTWSPDGKRLAVASADKCISIWNISDDSLHANLECVLARHTDDINSVAWLPDGQRVVAVSEDGTATVWNTITGGFQGVIASHSGHCMSVAISPTGSILTVAEDGGVTAENIDAGNQMARITMPCSIEGCAWSFDGRIAALACDDGKIRLVTPMLDIIDVIDVSKAAVRSVIWANRSHNVLFAGCYDGSVKVIQDKQVLSQTSAGRLWPRSISAWNDQLVAGSFGSTPVRYSRDLRIVIQDGGPATHGPNAIGSDKDHIFIGLDSGEVLISGNNLRGKKELISISDKPILSVAAIPGGFLAGTYDGNIHSYNTLTKRIESTVNVGIPIPSLATRPNGNLAIAGTYSGDILALSTMNGEIGLLKSRKVHLGSIKSLAWLNPQTSISGATDCLVKAHPEIGVPQDLWMHGNLVNAVATNYGGMIASASRDHLVRTSWKNRPSYLFGASESMKTVTIIGKEDHPLILGGSYDFMLYSWLLDPGKTMETRSGEILYQFNQAVSTSFRISAGRAIVASWDGGLVIVSLTRRGPSIIHTTTIEELLFHV